MLRPQRHMQSGFTLIEVMIGMVITLIATIVMFQIFAVSERQKRTTTGASDAQTNGALALYILEREVRQAGFNLLGSATNDCNPATTYAYYSDGAADFDMGGITQPVRIFDGGTGPDSIRTAMSASDMPDNFNFGRTNLRSTMPQSSSELNVMSTHGCAEGSLLLMVQPCAAGGTPAGSCTLMEITQVQPSALKLQHNPGSSGPTWNPKIPYQNGSNPTGAIWPAFKATASCKAYGICMPKPLNVGFPQFGIDASNNMTMRRVTSAGAAMAGSATEVMAPQIMDLQAQYGITNAGTVKGALNWQEATGIWAGSAALTQAQIKQIKAVRVAIVARSEEYEKPVNGVCQTTTVSPTYSWGTFNTTNWPADWQCYRYKVFETVIPLINVMWANV
ncbi:MAG: hypothetical protein H6R18_20 [Proteobacteria bacterium]|nr:hypothetical protein [Pseudomonadota bacterium]